MEFLIILGGIILAGALVDEFTKPDKDKTPELGSDFLDCSNRNRHYEEPKKEYLDAGFRPSGNKGWVSGRGWINN